MLNDEFDVEDPRLHPRQMSSSHPVSGFPGDSFGVFCLYVCDGETMQSCPSVGLRAEVS